MNAIKRKVWVLEKEWVKPIEIVRSTDAVPIQITVIDYMIPEGTTASVYALARGHTAHASMLADIDVDSNMIYFTPEAGFFPEGPCGLQVRLTGRTREIWSALRSRCCAIKMLWMMRGMRRPDPLITDPCSAWGTVAEVAALAEMTNQEMDIILTAEPSEETIRKNQA